MLNVNNKNILVALTTKMFFLIYIYNSQCYTHILHMDLPWCIMGFHEQVKCFDVIPDKDSAYEFVISEELNPRVCCCWGGIINVVRCDEGVPVTILALIILP